MDSPFRRELIVALKVLQECADLCQRIEILGQTLTTEKDDFTIVTVADLAVQALLITAFKGAFPDDSIVGEEDASCLRSNRNLRESVQNLLGSALDASRDNGTYQPVNLDWICDIMDQAGKHRIDYAPSARTWVFDPIDGTRTFVRGEMYAINIALLIGGKQAFSAVGCPRTSIHAKAPLHNSNVDPLGHGCVVYAVRGHGAYVVQLKGDIIASVPTRLPNLKDDVTNTIRFVTKASLAPHGLLDAHELIASRLCASYPGCDLLPWTLRWAILAMGLGNTTFWVYNRRERHAKIWDHAGAMLLFEETGGKITDVFGREIDLTAGRTLSNNFGFVAAPKHSHARVLQAVHEVLTEGEYRWVLGDSWHSL